MGNATSESVTKEINESMTNIMNEHSSECGQNTNAVQTIDLSDIHAGEGCSLNIQTKQLNLQQPNFTCLSQSDNSAKLQSAFEQDLQKRVSAKLEGITASSARTFDSTALVNKVLNNVRVSDVAKCVQNNMASQSTILDSITSSCPSICRSGGALSASQIEALGNACTVRIGTVQDLTQAAVANCTSNNATIQEVSNEISTKFKSDTTSEIMGIQSWMISVASSVCCFLVILLALII